MKPHAVMPPWSIPLSRQTLLRSTFGLGICSLLYGRPEFGLASAPVESRCIFDEGLTWLQPDRAEAVCARIARAGFNVFVPCIWHGQGTWWPSHFAPWIKHEHAEEFRRIGHDPVRHLISVARAHSVDVLLWFYVCYAGWRAPIRPDLRADDTPANFFDVHNQHFRTWISDVIAEAWLRYSDAAGICLDYLRSGGGGWHQPSWQTLYERHTGRSLILDLAPDRQEHAVDWHEAACRDIFVSELEQHRPNGAQS